MDRRLGFTIGMVALGLLGCVRPAGAETATVRIAQQYGISYLPLEVMKNRRLLEARVQATGLGAITVTWANFAGGTQVNDAMISGNLDIAAGGPPPLIKLWEKTQGRDAVMGVAAVSTMPFTLTTINPAVRTLADFSDMDRIALPAAKVGIHAVVLQMAAQRLWGANQFDHLDHLTVTMNHPDAVVALLSGRSEITAHFTSPPFVARELADPRVHKLLEAYDVLGGPSTIIVAWAPTSFRQNNPKTYGAFIAALADANRLIEQDPALAARIYLEEEHSREDPTAIEAMLRDPGTRFTTAPLNVMKFAAFLYDTGQIKRRPETWKDLFFPEIADQNGS
ncbi:MAG: ABC transporter substrate-binding protein [Pseudomonadota bacterium]